MEELKRVNPWAWVGGAATFVAVALEGWSRGKPLVDGLTGSMVLALLAWAYWVISLSEENLRRWRYLTVVVSASFVCTVGLFILLMNPHLNALLGIEPYDDDDVRYALILPFAGTVGLMFLMTLEGLLHPYWNPGGTGLRTSSRPHDLFQGGEEGHDHF